MTSLLTTTEVHAALRELPGWTGGTDGLARTYRAPDFLTGIRLVAVVAEVAEAADHHPDIDIRWRNVTFQLVTHSAGGVTAKDVDLARRIDSLAREHDCR